MSQDMNGNKLKYCQINKMFTSTNYFTNPRASKIKHGYIWGSLLAEIYIDGYNLKLQPSRKLFYSLDAMVAQ